MRGAPVAERSHFYRSSFGSVRLFISVLSTSRPRTLVVHESARGDKHVVQDRGAGIVTVQTTLLFDYMDGDTLTPKDRVEEFRALCDGTARVFTHPTSGSFSALPGQFTEGLDAHGNITAEVEFTADGPVTDALPPGAASIPASGEGLVDAAADAFSAELDEIGEDDLDIIGLGDDSKTTADAWVANPNVSQREVAAQGGALNERAKKGMSKYVTLDNWQMFKSTVILADSIKTAADQATLDSLFTVSMVTASSEPLRALVAKVYGADQVDRRYQQIMDINDIATPGLLDVGTKLQLPGFPTKDRHG